MNKQEREQKRKLFRRTLVAALIVETILVAMMVFSLLREEPSISPWQLIVFFLLLVWIYFAYLKQRALLMSVSMVDEKIKTHSLVASLSDGVILLDSDNRVLILNRAAAEATGLSELDSLGKDLAEEVGDTVRNVLRSGGEGEMDGEFVKTGRRVRLSVKKLEAKNAENAVKLLYVRALETGGEVKTSGQPTVGDAGIMPIVKELIPLLAGAGRPSPDSKVAFLGLRLFAHGLLLEACPMRESILDGSLARTLKKQKVPWKSVVDGVLGEVSALASVVGVKVDSSKVSTDVVEADEALLKMALKQVVVNAILASVSGGKLVALQTAAMGQNIGLAALDSGSAVPRENLHGLYQMPYAGVKAADGTLCRADGTGLCLARGIVEAHSGTFLAESPPQGGLRVVMILAAPSRG